MVVVLLLLLLLLLLTLLKTVLLLCCCCLDFSWSTSWLRELIPSACISLIVSKSSSLLLAAFISGSRNLRRSSFFPPWESHRKFGLGKSGDFAWKCIISAFNHCFALFCFNWTLKECQNISVSFMFGKLFWGWNFFFSHLPGRTFNNFRAPKCPWIYEERGINVFCNSKAVKCSVG